MAIRSALIRKLLGFAGGIGARLWRATIDWKALYFDPTVDTVHPQFAGRYVYAGWHEVMMMPIVMRAQRDMLALTSEHGDGDIISRAMECLGWSVTRGSTTHGSVPALMRMLREDTRHLSVTPDGPRGPRRSMSAGALFLASKLELPLVCAGYGFDRPWRMRSWDRFAVPRPFARGRAVFGPPLRLPVRMARATLEGHRLWFERLLTWLTDEAEAWATSGQRRPGELPMLVGEAPSGMARWRPVDAPKLPEALAAAWMELGNPPIGEDHTEKHAA